MSVGIVDDSRRSTRRLSRLPEPAARTGAHARAGKRVREDVKDAAAVAAFSLLISVGFAVALTLVTRTG